VVIAAGRCASTPVNPLALAHFIGQLRYRQDSGATGWADYATNVKEAMANTFIVFAREDRRWQRFV